MTLFTLDKVYDVPKSQCTKLDLCCSASFEFVILCEISEETYTTCRLCNEGERCIGVMGAAVAASSARNEKEIAYIYALVRCIHLLSPPPPRHPLLFSEFNDARAHTRLYCIVKMCILRSAFVLHDIAFGSLSFFRDYRVPLRRCVLGL